MKNKKKLLILHYIIAPYRNPLFEELSKEYDLTVYFCKENNKDRYWSTKLDGFSFIYKILPSLDFGPFVLNPTLKKELMANAFDAYIIFENPENTFSIIDMINIAKKNNIPIILVNGRIDDEIYTLYNLKETKNVFKKVVYTVTKIIYQKYREFIYKKSGSFTSYCSTTTNYLISKGIGRNKIFTGIQNYPESLLPEPTWKEKPKEFGDKNIIIYVGNLKELKGINYLIDAFNKINRNDTLLLIIGKGDQEEQLKKLAENNKNIIFLGYKESIDRANYYSIASFFVFPTLHDSWGHVITEALFYGIPVITTDKAEAKELIDEGKTGFIIPDKNSDILFKTMNLLLDDPKLLLFMKENVKKITKLKIVDINTSVNVFLDAIKYVLQDKNEKN